MSGTSSRCLLQSFAALQIAGRSSRQVAPSHISRVASRSLTTSAAHRDEVTEELPPVHAAPELTIEELKSEAKQRQYTKKAMSKLRVVPVSPSYFSARPQSTDDLLMLLMVLRECQTLPVCKPTEVPKVSWRSYYSYRALVGQEPMKSTRFSRMLELAKRLNAIHPAIRPPSVNKAIARFAIDLNPQEVKKKPILIDSWGRTLGVGRRKTCTAKVWLVEGQGEVLVNGQHLVDAFARPHDRESVLWALKATNRIDKYNVFVKVNGGGTTGQAEATALGLSKALIAQEPPLKPFLRAAGVVARDPRMVERKKHGRVKARKMPTWVKR